MTGSPRPACPGSSASADNPYRLQPFGGYLSRHRKFEGFCLPTRVEAGNFFRAARYSPFLVVDVLSVRVRPLQDP